MKMRTIVKRYIPIFLIFNRIILADSVTSAHLVDEAWEAWNKNDQALVEQKFREAIKADPGNTRAYVGLAYLYEMQYKFQEAWKIYANVTRTELDYEPYIFAAMMTQKLTSSEENRASGILTLFDDLSRNARSTTMQVNANEKLGRYYNDHADLKKALFYYDKIDAITDWMLIGPFDNISASGFDKIYPPEEKFDTAQTYFGKNDITIKWFNIPQIRYDKWIDLRRYYPDDNAVFYGNTFIYSPEKQTVDLRVGTSGALKVFLNDELMVACFDENNNGYDTYSVRTTLQKGWNRLLIKCGYSEITQCNFAVRLTDPQGQPISNLEISTAPQTYNSKPGAEKLNIPNFAEAFFRKKIEEHPDYLENYLLLAECYALNDKAVESELILRDALKRAPENAMIYLHLIEAYQRGEKYDEVNTAFEKIYRLDPKIPVVLEHRISEALENQDYDEASVLLDKLAVLIPDSPNLQQQYIVYYSKRSLPDKMIETVHAAYEKFPENWNIVQTEAIVESMVKQDQKQGIPIIRKYLKKHTVQDVFLHLAEYYQNTGDFKNWEKTYQQLLSYYPVAPGFLYQMARNYYTVHDYLPAGRYIEEALKICPQCAVYMGTRAEIERSAGQKDAAVRDYERALQLKPTYFEARDQLRELRQLPSVFSNFYTANIDSLYQNSPSAAKYPGDKAVVLYNASQRVVYGGATESRHEILTKVFNSDGIDDFKEYVIPFNGYNEALIIEKAQTLKKDGSKIDADVQNNHIVFKALEADESVYLKWKVRSYYAGELSRHFWDEVNFNMLYPVLDIRYDLLIAPDVPFKVTGQNMSKEPTSKRLTPDGILYEWCATNEPAITEEYRMPPLADVGKILHIGSIPDWNYIVNWYYDLAETKTRTSYEIDEFLGDLLPEGENLSDREKITRIYNFITEEIRYSSVSFRQSGLVPQKARDVFVNRIGDCKDKAALGIAMLRAAGLNAYFVLVNTRNEGLNKDVLPSIAFNHAIVAVETSEGKYYLDLTAQNYPVGSIPVPDQNAFALEILPGNFAPMNLGSQYFIGNVRKRRTVVEVGTDNSITVEIKTIRKGAQTADIRNVYRYKNQADRLKEISESLSQDYPNVTLLDFQITDLDSITPTLTYEYSFSVPNYLSTAGNMMIMAVPWADKFIPIKALSYDKRNYPLIYWPNADTVREEIEIHLPAGYKLLEFTPSYNYTCAIADFNLDLKLENGILYGTRQIINKEMDVNPEDYPAFKEFYNNVVKADANQLLLNKD